MSAMPQLIESLQNPQFKRWKSLLDSRGLAKHRQFLLSGRKTVPEALLRYPDRFQSLLYRHDDQLSGLTLPPHLKLYRLAPVLYRELDIVGTQAALLVGDLPEFGVADLAQPPQGLELICALGNPDNLGAMLRSAAAFGVSRVILLAEAAHPFHPRALRAAANAQFELQLVQGPRWQALQQAQGPLFALDAGGESLADFAWPRNLRLVLGEEGKGLPDGLALQRLAIPTTGAVESLNASIAASLALFSYFSGQQS